VAVPGIALDRTVGEISGCLLEGPNAFVADVLDERGLVEEPEDERGVFGREPAQTSRSVPATVIRVVLPVIASHFTMPSSSTSKMRVAPPGICGGRP